MATINDVWAAYEGAQGHWSGCNWPTHYGALGLNLDGVSSRQAHQATDRWRAVAADEVPGVELTPGEETSLVDMALHLRLRHAVVCRGEEPNADLHVCGSTARRFCAEALAREWEFASYWLAEIESDARWAEQEGWEAVRAAEEGDWEHALGHARQACSIESGYDAPRPWERLEQAVERAAR